MPIKIVVEEEIDEFDMNDGEEITINFYPKNGDRPVETLFIHNKNGVPDITASSGVMLHIEEDL